jgi:hypothetical protein
MPPGPYRRSKSTFWRSSSGPGTGTAKVKCLTAPGVTSMTTSGLSPMSRFVKTNPARAFPGGMQRLIWSSEKCSSIRRFVSAGSST